MKNQSGLFTRWYQEFEGFNFSEVHKKGKKNCKADELSQSTHMVEAPPLKDENYAEYYEMEVPVIRFVGGVNNTQLVQSITVEKAEEQA